MGCSRGRRAGPARGRRALVALALGVGCWGCGGAPYELADVSGTVRIDGKPFPHGKVMFAPVSQADAIEVGKPAFGLLGPDGGFSLSTYADGDGAVVGKHWVTVFRVDDGPNGPAPAGVPKFGRVTSPEPVEVAAGSNAITVDLTAEQIRRFGAAE